MPSSTLVSLDLFLRAAAIGQVLLVAAVHLRGPLQRGEGGLMAVGLCLVAQLLLGATADAPGVWRHLLLVFTDASAYAVWFAALTAIDDRFATARWSAGVKLALAVLAVWHVYFFGVLGGEGPYHAANHVIAVILLLHVIAVALLGWRDDLIDSRRRTRLLIAGMISAYGIVLAAAQLVGNEWRDSDAFSLANAALSFAGTLMFGRHVLRRPMPAAPVPQQPVSSAPDAPPPPEVPAELRALNHKLDAFLQSGGYTRANLTITALADALGCTEHRLRRLINGGLGHRNFSDFLNKHRVAEACRQLADPQLDTPVLTMALDLGYGSIGPFNRAFKAQTGLTPTEFRDAARTRP